MIDDIVEYWGYSELFDKIEEGYCIPEYYITAKQTMQDGLCFTDVKAERV